MATSNSTSIQLPLPLENEILVVPLTRGCVTTIDAVDYDLAMHKWYAEARQGNHKYGYVARRRTKSGLILLSRVVASRIVGRALLPNEEVDHINRNPLDNRRSNLRIANRTENIANTRLRSDNLSGYKGVSFCKSSKRWHARIGMNGRTHFLGSFDTVEGAACAYDRKAFSVWGESAYLNFPLGNDDRA